MTDDLWTRERLRALIDSLGIDPDEVAGTLLKAHCEGARGTYDDCPIAVWLRRQGAPGPQVQALTVSVAVDDDRDDTASLSIYTSEAVRQFVELFDVGAYEELEVEP